MNPRRANRRVRAALAGAGRGMTASPPLRGPIPPATLVIAGTGVHEP